MSLCYKGSDLYWLIAFFVFGAPSLFYCAGIVGERTAAWIIQRVEKQGGCFLPHRFGPWIQGILIEYRFCRRCKWSEARDQ